MFPAMILVYKATPYPIKAADYALFKKLHIKKAIET